MKNEDLLKFKIKINCKNKNKLAYQDMAYLVDKPAFLKLIPDLRKQYSIKKLIPLKDFSKWWVKKIKKDLYLNKNKNAYFLSIEKSLKEYKKNPDNLKKLFSMLPYHQRFDWETQFLTRRFKRPGYFHLIIKHAIVCGEVNDKSWQTTYATVMPPELPVTDSPLPEVVIVVSPMTRSTELEKVFKKQVQKLFEKNKDNLKYLSVVKDVTAPKTRRSRRWYWLSLSGKKPGDIYEIEYLNPDKPSKEKDINIESISKTIDRYQKILDNF